MISIANAVPLIYSNPDRGGIISQEEYHLAMPQNSEALSQNLGPLANRAKASHWARPPDAMPPSFARHALEGITANHVLDRTQVYPELSISIREFADHWLKPNQHDYVALDNGSVAGIVSLTRLRFVPKGTWAATPVRNILRLQTPEARQEEPIEDVLKRMTDNSLTVIPVMDEETQAFLGTVNSRDVLDLAACPRNTSPQRTSSYLH